MGSETQSNRKEVVMTHVEGKHGKPADNTYLLSVDYGRSVEDGVKAGCYDLVNPDIISRNFPTKGKGEAEITLELIDLKKFKRFAWTEEGRSEFYVEYRWPADLHELLAFGEKHPDVQREFLIAAPSSVWKSQYGNRRVPCIGMSGSARYLDLYSFSVLVWRGDCRFAVVRK